MSQGFDELMALYRASVKQSPALMSEHLQVDSNRGVTSRGNSPYDKFAPPETRAKVLEARMQEIDAFATSRMIPTAAVYAAAEAAMRTGKIPDLGQFGMAGDDAVAAKQFLISNVLNIQGLEWTDYKGDPVIEADVRDAAKDLAKRERAQKRDRAKTQGGFQMSDINSVADQIMAEGAQEGMRKGTQANTGEYGRARGGRPDSGRIDKVDLKIGKTRSRREGKEAGEAGRVEYEVDKREKQQDDVSVDPSRFMSEGSTSLRKLQQGGHIDGPPRGVTFGGHPSGARTEKGWQSLKRRNARGQDSMMDPPSQAEIGDNLKIAAHRRETTQERTPEGRVPAHPEAGSNRSYLDKVKIERGRESAERKARGELNKKLVTKKSVTSSVDVDPSRFMAEEGGPYQSGGAPQSAPLSPGRMSDGGMALTKPQSYERHDLLPKEIINKLKQTMGDAVHNLTRDELFAIARERGLLGTEESMGEAAIGYDFVAADEANRKLDDKELHAAHKAAQTKALNTPNSDPMQPHHYDHASALNDEIRRRAKPKGPTPVKGWPHSHLSDEELHAAHKASVDNTMSMDNQDPRRGASTDRSSDLQQEINRRAKPSRGKKVESFEEGQRFQEHDYQETAKQHGGKFVSYIPGNVGVYEFKTEDGAAKFAGHYTTKTTATPKVDGKRVFVKETSIGEDHEALTRTATRLAELSQEKIKDDDQSIDAEIMRHTTGRSESDKILGIEAGDPRAEAWPKLSDEMRGLLNLEDHGVFRTRRGFSMPDAPAPITEATSAGGVGAFIGAGMGGGLAARTAPCPSYDASYNLPDDPDERVKVLKKMLDKHGLKSPIEGKDVKEETSTASEKSEPPVMRDPQYNTHPSRFMK